MANLQELRRLFDDSDLREKIEVAIVKEAQSRLGSASTDAEKRWIAAVLIDPSTEATRAQRYVLAANAGLTVTQILQANDVAIESNVSDATDLLIAAYSL